ncbi:hypothetical protein NMY22_g2519 [Coprinellus aureogranulatus]|nr:hypothetical protein NMY22_g2519 [Coprinellus aureogranulatus]
MPALYKLGLYDEDSQSPSPLFQHHRYGGAELEVASPSGYPGYLASFRVQSFETTSSQATEDEECDADSTVHFSLDDNDWWCDGWALSDLIGNVRSQLRSLRIKGVTFWDDTLSCILRDLPSVTEIRLERIALMPCLGPPRHHIPAIEDLEALMENKHSCFPNLKTLVIHLIDHLHMEVPHLRPLAEGKGIDLKLTAGKEPRSKVPDAFFQAISDVLSLSECLQSLQSETSVLFTNVELIQRLTRHRKDDWALYTSLILDVRPSPRDTLSGEGDKTEVVCAGFGAEILPRYHPLTTNNATTHETAMRQQQVEGLEHQQRQLSELLALTQSQLQDITSQLHVLQPVISPVRRLPLEILGEIFKQVIPTSNTRPNSYQRALGKLPLVCKSWRDAAYHTPGLWCEIWVRADAPTLSYEHLNVWVRRAGVAEPCDGVPSAPTFALEAAAFSPIPYLPRY